MPDRWVTEHGAAVSITVDHDTEFTSKALEVWAWQRGMDPDFILPWKPMENEHIESFNGRLRDECLNVYQFLSLEDAKQKIEAYRMDYNLHRPHSAEGHLTPVNFINMVREIDLRKLRLSSFELSRNGGNFKTGKTPIMNCLLDGEVYETRT